MVARPDTFEPEPVAADAMVNAYAPLPTVERMGPAVPGDTCCGYVAVARQFPFQPRAHLYDRLYPTKVEVDPNTQQVTHVADTMGMRNDPALARGGIAALMTIQPKCMSPVDRGAYYETMTNFANTRGAVACPACWPDAYGMSEVDEYEDDPHDPEAIW